MAKNFLAMILMVISASGCLAIRDVGTDASSVSSVSTPCTGTPFSGGSGTALDPYQICNRAQLANIDTSGNNLAAAYIQTADIDLAGCSAQFTPIGTVNGTFSGIYDGGGYKIENFCYHQASNGGDVTAFDSTANAIGLFQSSSGTLKNITLATPTLVGNSFLGALVGNQVSGTIQDCLAYNVTITGAYERDGALVGQQSSGTITRSGAIGTVIAAWTSGGFVGASYGTVSQSFFCWNRYGCRRWSGRWR